MAKKNPFLPNKKAALIPKQGQFPPMGRNLFTGKGIAPLSFGSAVMFDPKKAGMPSLFGGRPVYMGQSRYALAGLRMRKKWGKS